MGNGQSGAGKKVTTIRIIVKIITPDRPSPNSQDCKASSTRAAAVETSQGTAPAKSSDRCPGPPTAPFLRCLAGWSVSRHEVSQIDRRCHKGGVAAPSLDLSA